MVAAYREGLRPLLAGGGFDVVHAQDCISANAALDLRDEGVIDARRAHRPPRRRLHLAVARSPARTARSSRPTSCSASREPWVAAAAPTSSASRPGSCATASTAPASAPPRDAAERAADRAALGLGDRLAVLTVGGIEPRKGSLTLLEGFAAAARAGARARPAAARRRRRDAVRLPRRDRALRRPRARARRQRARAPRRHRRRRPSSSATTARPTSSRFPPRRRASASSRSRRSPPGCRSSPRRSTSSAPSCPTAKARCCRLPGDGGALGAVARAARAGPARCASGSSPAAAQVVDAYGWDVAAAAHEDAYRSFQADALIGALSDGRRARTSRRAGSGGLSADVTARDHELIADEPETSGGGDAGHDADRALLRRAGELLLPRRRARRGQARHRAARACG